MFGVFDRTKSVLLTSGRPLYNQFKRTSLLIYSSSISFRSSIDSRMKGWLRQKNLAAF